MSSYGPHRVRPERDLSLPMRDGTRQLADVHLPAGQAGPFPVILERTPYSKEASSEIQIDAHNFYASHGYAVVISDVRGRFKGEGQFYPFIHHARDGYDTIEWIAAQPWCNGRVGMMGGSYSGVTQYQVMSARPPHLRCLFARESSSDYSAEWVFRGGAFELAFMWYWAVKWQLQSGRARGDLSATRIAELEDALEHIDEHFARLPIAPVALLEGGYDWYNEWLARCDEAELWNSMNTARLHAECDLPVMHLGGWFDIFQRGTFEHFQGLRRTSRSPQARAWQRLVVGPWIHGPKQLPLTTQGEVDFGPAAAQDFNDLRLPWYDLWLKQDPGAVDRSHVLPLHEAPVRVFVMGANEWREFADWPPPGVRFTDFYLRAHGALSRDAPGAGEAPDTYTYDPLRPTPSGGGNTLYIAGGSRDQREAEKTGLVFTSQSLVEDLTVAGPVRCVLHAASSCRDTDWVVRLSDVPPDGRSLLVCDGILRARYRESRWQPTLLERGRIYRLEVDLWSTAHRFKRGHRLRVAVCSSSFPRFDRNLNTGERLYFDARHEVAHNTIHHAAARPSALTLPVLSE